MGPLWHVQRRQPREALPRRAWPEDGRLLDEELDALFGSPFSRVVEHHFVGMTGAGLWRVLIEDPEAARATMGAILGSDRAAAFVFRELRKRLGRAERGACGPAAAAPISKSISR